MTRPPPSPGVLAWLVDGDGAATLSNLADAVDAGRLDEIDRLRAIWWLQAFTSSCRPHPTAAAILCRLDPDGTMPPAPDITELRFWVDSHWRQGPRGSLGRLARYACLHSADVAKLRGGRSLTPEKRERLAAALIATGRMSNPNTNSRRFLPPNRSKGPKL